MTVTQSMKYLRKTFYIHISILVVQSLGDEKEIAFENDCENCPFMNILWQVLLI